MRTLKILHALFGAMHIINLSARNVITNVYLMGIYFSSIFWNLEEWPSSHTRDNVDVENHGYKPTMEAASVPSGLCQKDREHHLARPTQCRL